MYQYKIEKIRFNDGTELQPGSLTIVVGPNNCGKSRFLKDIKSFTCDEEPTPVVTDDVKFALPKDIDSLKQTCEISAVFDNRSNHTFLRTLSADLASQHNVVVRPGWEESLQSTLTEGGDQAVRMFRHWLGSFFVSLFETEERLKASKECESSENGNASNLLQAFYQQGPKVEEELRGIVKETFGRDIRLDCSSLRRLLFRIGYDFDDCPPDPRNQIEYFRGSESLDEQGDGLRSFVATLLAVLVGERPLLLLDEPESFLHPPQAYRLGEVIAERATEQKQVIIATHSSDFLRGVLSKRPDVTIVRIDRDGESNNFNLLDSKQVNSIAVDPLLSSARILEGLFYKAAIIVEADADAVFYQRIARQLGNPEDFHITHAHNKQTVAKVLPPYRALKIPFASIVDFDVIRVGSEFRELLKQLGMPGDTASTALKLQLQIVKSIEGVDYRELLSLQLGELQSELDRIRENAVDTPEDLLTVLSGNLKRIRQSGSPWKKYKEKGATALTETAVTAFAELDAICSEFGLFIVPVGELESWLVDHGLPYSSKKSRWIVNALEKIPRLEPRVEDQPWAFVQRVFNYLSEHHVMDSRDCTDSDAVGARRGAAVAGPVRS